MKITPGKSLSWRQRLGLIFLAAMGAMALMIFWPEPKEPEYQGKKLSEWVAPYSSQVSPPEFLPANNQDVEAVHHIGTNALPFLLEWIRKEPPSWSRRLGPLYTHIPKSISGAMMDDPGDSRRNAASWAFWVLGPLANSAVPELTRIATNTNAPESAQNAIYALGCIGGDGFAPLLAILSDPGQPGWAHSRAGYMIGNRNDLGTNGNLAVPILIKSLSDSDVFVAIGAASTLGNLKLQAEVVVPGLTNAMANGNPSMRRFVIEALGKFGPAAKGAVPVLLKIANDSQRAMREAATNALLKIAPEVLTNGVSANHE